VVAVAKVEGLCEQLGNLETRGPYSSVKKIIITNLTLGSIVSLYVQKLITQDKNSFHKFTSYDKILFPLVLTNLLVTPLHIIPMCSQI